MLSASCCFPCEGRGGVGGGGGGRWRGGGRGSRGGRKNLSRFGLAGKHSAGKQIAVGWTASDPVLFSSVKRRGLVTATNRNGSARPNAD